MRSYKILLVEDSDDEAATLQAHLRRYASHVGVAFQIERLSSALDFMRDDLVCDLVFMDIDLPGINGMEAAEYLRMHDAQTPLIFVTNLAQYAVQGYQVDALDFMVKPVSYEDFSLRMGRAMRVMERRASRSIAITSSGETHVVELSDIRYVELQGHNLLYHVAGQTEPLKARGSMREARQELPQELFLPISQGCIVNMEHIRAVRNDSLDMDDGVTLYFSRSRKRPGLETLARFFGGTI